MDDLERKTHGYTTAAAAVAAKECEHVILMSDDKQHY